MFKLLNNNNKINFFFLFYLIIITIKKVYLINDIEEKNILLEENKQFLINKNSCIKIKIPNNYKKINLTILTNNLKKFILIDKEINNTFNLNNNNKFSCPKEINNLFCFEYFNPFLNYFTINNCIEKSYVYACSNNYNDSYINLNLKVIDKLGCILNNNYKKNECLILGTNKCKNEYYCNMKCQYIECLNENNIKIQSMCLPINYTDNQIIEKCKNHIDFNDKGKIVKKFCTNPVNLGNFHLIFLKKILKIIIISLVIIIIICYITSIWYRIKLKLNINNNPPFNPPFFCPRILFPR